MTKIPHHSREPEIGQDFDDVTSLTQALVRINSASPTLGFVAGPGETAVAKFVRSWLQARDIGTHWLEKTPGRPSVVGIVRGSGNGKTLMLNGHMDTVTLEGYDGDPLAGRIEGNKMYGRGAADMKSGLAAAMITLSRARALQLAGDVILAAVADEEDASIGTMEVIEAGWRADAAIIMEPTGMDIIVAHKGFVVYEMTIFGVAAHGSRPELGVDAICKAGHVLVAIDALGKRLQNTACSSSRPEVDVPSVHVGLIKGGEEISSFPAKCTLWVQRRLTPDETAESARLELHAILYQLATADVDFRFELRTLMARLPYVIADSDPFVQLVARHATSVMKTPAVLRGEK
ncbi:uncharacterized protein RHO25_007090 [Cercospora beticola]|uniref:Peptidase M20 dimerisation domain-containing protein n=1 Tax=Cercospora beticola TaxID=122368 RepID=A0ABZ0NSB5_CERBT|nr:hypothetical protein RHO25_007090 [Cercospora beticola]CAK1362654.1 unnamed protein product [Cercospora beticola]